MAGSPRDAAEGPIADIKTSICAVSVPGLTLSAPNHSAAPKRSTARADLSERSGTRGLVWRDVVEDRPERPCHHYPIPRGSVCERRQRKPSALRGFQGELSARGPRSTGSPTRQGAQRRERRRLLGNLTIDLA